MVISRMKPDVFSGQVEGRAAAQYEMSHSIRNLKPGWQSSIHCSFFHHSPQTQVSKSKPQSTPLSVREESLTSTSKSYHQSHPPSGSTKFLPHLNYLSILKASNNASPPSSTICNPHSVYPPRPRSLGIEIRAHTKPPPPRSSAPRSRN